MYTAICSFDDKATAQGAVERLLDAGFARHDVHLTHRHADGSEFEKPPNDTWDGLEREIAVDRSVVENFGNFFGSLFGLDDPERHADKYASAVERGHYVVVVDAKDDADGERAQAILHGLEGRDLSRVHRPTQKPLRDIVGERQAAGMEQRFGTARSEMGAGHNSDVRREGEFPRERDRAMAAPHQEGMAPGSQGWGEQRTLELRDDDEPRMPSLRSADGDGGDKPR